jgi:hypothetical protein
MVFVFALHLNHHVTNYFLYQKRFILDFEIQNFTPTLSDVHSQLHISLKIPKKENALTAETIKSNLS